MNAFETWQVVLGISQACFLLAAVLGALYIGLKQNEINQGLLDLNFSISLEVTYAGKKINILNKGKTNISIFGTKLGNEAKNISNEPRLITSAGFYYLNAKDLEPFFLKNLGEDNQKFIPFEIYLKDERQKKFIAKNLFLIKQVGESLEIHTQTTSIIQSDW